MTQRKRAIVFYALPAMLCFALAYGNNLKSAPLASQSINPFYVTLKDTTLYPALTDSFYHTPNAEVLLPQMPQIQLNKQAGQYVNTYIKKNELYLQKIEARSAPYFKIIESVFKKHNLPLQLKYLAVVESALKASSVSRVGAKGPWQLMPQTARELGLKITTKYDERTHYYKSTQAAARYLKQLYGYFDDWLLVVAAYNSGPGTVFKAIRLSGSRNFWHLQHHLPAETRAHVKHFIGVHYFFENTGSETVLTKKEREAYEALLYAYQQKMGSSDSLIVQAKVPTLNTNTETTLEPKLANKK